MFAKPTTQLLEANDNPTSQPSCRPLCGYAGPRVAQTQTMPNREGEAARTRRFPIRSFTPLPPPPLQQPRMMWPRQQPSCPLPVEYRRPSLRKRWGLIIIILIIINGSGNGSGSSPFFSGGTARRMMERRRLRQSMTEGERSVRRIMPAKPRLRRRNQRQRPG